MASSVWERLRNEMRTVGIIPRTRAAQAWYRGIINHVRIPTNRSNVLHDPKRVTHNVIIGQMICYRYHPKYEDVLPTWDEYPLVLPMEIYGDSFLGLNLHYLDPGNRLALLELLHDFITNTKYDDSTRFKLSYSVLNGIKKYEIMRPCIKKYLVDHMASSVIRIEPDFWELACLLPFERFHHNY